MAWDRTITPPLPHSLSFIHCAVGAVTFLLSDNNSTRTVDNLGQKVKMASQPLTLHITWHFPPEQVPKFYEVLRPLHEQIKQEKECLYFNVYEIAQQPGVVRLVEIWDCDMKWMVDVSSLSTLIKENESLINGYRCNLRKIITGSFLGRQRKLRYSRRRLKL